METTEERCHQCSTPLTTEESGKGVTCVHCQRKARLAKILALATNNTNRPEAEAALLKAQTLMAEADEPWLAPEKPIVEEEVAKDLSPWFMRLMQVVALNFRVFYMVDEAAGALAFVGHEEDVALARPVALAARRAAQYLAASWWQQNPDQPLAAQEAYLQGFVTGLHERFRDQVAKEGYAMMLCRSPALEAYMGGKGFYKAKGGPLPVADWGAYGDGIDAGKSYQSTNGRVLNNGP